MPRYLLDIAAQAPTQALEGCLQLMGRMESVAGEVPLPTSPLRNLLAKFLNSRLGIQILPESQEFDVCEWVSELEEAASFELLSKLQSALADYWITFPKQKPHDAWLV